MSKIDVPIKGMHCRSCEILISDKLKEISGVKKVEISFKKSRAIILTDREVSMLDIKNAVKEAGYEVGNTDKKSWISKNPADYKRVTIALIILLAIYFLFKKLGFNGLNIGSIGSSSSLFVVLLIGLTAGISTCMALVGGLVLGISARHAEAHPEATPLQKFKPHLFFNLGRVLSFVILGGIIGLAGKAFQFSGSWLGIVTIGIGLIMFILGLQLIQIFPRLSNFSLSLPSKISKFFGIKERHEKEYNHFNSAIVGALTFFLPCGFTQAMQIYAISTGSFAKGALIMGIFALGTMPGLLGIGGLTSFVKGAFAKKFFIFIGLVVILFGLLNIQNGSNLIGINLKISSASKIDSQNNAEIKNGVQVINMIQDDSGYSPTQITIQKDIPVKWMINSKNPYSCAGSLYVPDLKIQKRLNQGENVIEFTPYKAGIIKFSCLMGMYSGSIIVK